VKIIKICNVFRIIRFMTFVYLLVLKEEHAVGLPETGSVPISRRKIRDASADCFAVNQVPFHIFLKESR